MKLYTQINSEEQKKQIKFLTLDYMMARVSELYYAKNNKQISSEEMLARFFLYPFIITLANGYAEELHEVVGKFKANEIGPFPESMIEWVENKNGNIGINFENTTFSVNKTPENIKKIEIEKDVPFEQIYLERPSKGVRASIPVAIDSAFKALNIQFEGGFVDLPYSRLYSICCKRGSYLYTFRESPNSLIDWRSIELDRRTLRIEKTIESEEQMIQVS